MIKVLTKQESKKGPAKANLKHKIECKNTEGQTFAGCQGYKAI
jgi:hypothetical protein